MANFLSSIKIDHRKYYYKNWDDKYRVFLQYNRTQFFKFKFYVTSKMFKIKLQVFHINSSVQYRHN